MITYTRYRSTSKEDNNIRVFKCILSTNDKFNSSADRLLQKKINI